MTSILRGFNRHASTQQLQQPSPCAGDKSNESNVSPPYSSFECKEEEPTFEDLYGDRMPSWLLERMNELGFLRPMNVQRGTLDLTLGKIEKGSMHLGKDAVIHAQTGSGKTLAYLLPAISAVDPTRASVQALILVPTQELGMQVYKTLRRLTVAWRHFADEGRSQVLDERSKDICAWLDGVKVSQSEGDQNLATERADDKQFNEDAENLSDELDIGDEDGIWPHMDTEAAKMNFPVLPMLNQADFRRQKLQLRRTVPRMVVGNPHRIAELVECGRLRLDLLRVLVVDEFDSCLLDNATTSALQTVLAVRGREQRQTILASATVPQHRHFLRQCIRQRWTSADIEHIWIEEKSGECVPISLHHMYALCESRKKLSALRMLLQYFGECEQAGTVLERSIVFVMASRPVATIVSAINEALYNSGWVDTTEPVVGLWNEMSIGDRRRAMRRFRNADARVLVATDLAARGLDIPGVSHVFHMDLPTDADSYLHRAGRAGREGRKGTSVCLVSPGEEFVIRRISNSLNVEFDLIRSNAAAKIGK